MTVVTGEVGETTITTATQTITTENDLSLIRNSIVVNKARIIQIIEKTLIIKKHGQMKIVMI
jgi:hypothetical protein